MICSSDIGRAAEVLRRGGLVAFPTETVYGLGANALDPDAVKKIFAAKGRPGDNPLILHVSAIEDVERYASADSRAEALMRKFWPGPLTLVLQARDIVPLIARGGLDTVGVRMPKHPVALDLIHACGFPLAAPSANASGRPSPTTAAAVEEDLGNSVDMILDDGPCEVGLESTVLDASGGELFVLRPGGVTREMLSAAGFKVAGDSGDARRSPGTRYRHYAPNIPVRLWRGGEPLDVGTKNWGYVGISEPPCAPAVKIMASSPREYARILFTALRELESSGATIIVAELPGDADIGSALINRLLRASGSL